MQSAGPDGGFQLAWHYHRPETRWVADSERCAVRGRTVAATRATGSTSISCPSSGLGQDAIHLDRHSPGVIVGIYWHGQSSKNINPRVAPRGEGLMTVFGGIQSSLCRGCEFVICWGMDVF